MRMSIIVWFILLVAISLLITGLANAYAFDYFPNNVYTLKENGVVCVLNPPPDKKFYILKGINAWDRYMGLNYYTVKVITYEFFDCNATLVFANPATLWPDTDNHLAVTKCWDEPHLSQLGESIIMKRYCRAAVNLDTTEHLYYNAVVHETGHMLGIGHRLPYNATDFPYVFGQKDMMFPLIDKGVKLTQESLDALEYFRNNPQIKLNYTIPHE